MELALNQDQGALQVSKIASSTKIPVKYLEQLLRALKQAGLVKSVRGAKGGHVLIENPKDITLGKIVRMFEGQTDLVECVSYPENCDMASECLVRHAWHEATSVLYDKLDGISIADLISEKMIAKACQPFSQKNSKNKK